LRVVLGDVLGAVPEVAQPGVGAGSSCQAHAPPPSPVGRRAPSPKPSDVRAQRHRGANSRSRPLDVASSREAVKHQQAQAKRAGPRPAGQSTPSRRHQAPCPATPGTEHASEATGMPSSVPPLTRRGRSSIWDAGCPAPRAADPRAKRRTPSATRRSEPRIALLYGLAPGRACPFHPAQPACAGLPVRHCGAGPHLAVDGCYPLPCVAELGLSSCRHGFPRRGTRPSDRLAGASESSGVPGTAPLIVPLLPRRLSR
jgi:hypothetical protein